MDHDVLGCAVCTCHPYGGDEGDVRARQGSGVGRIVAETVVTGARTVGVPHLTDDPS